MKKVASAAAAAAAATAAVAAPKQRQIPVPYAPADVFDWWSRIGVDLAADVVPRPFSETRKRGDN